MALRQTPTGKWQIDVVVAGQRIRETVATKHEAVERMKALRKNAEKALKARNSLSRY